MKQECYQLNQNDLRRVCRLLARIETSEATDFRKMYKKNALNSLKLFPNGGLLTVYRDDEETHAVCAFQDVVSDYETLKAIEDTVNEYLKALGEDETLTFVHGTEQLVISEFVCKLNFERPHYGYEYKLMRRDFDCGAESDLMGLEAKPYRYDDADAMFTLHERAFREQTLRAGHPEGYDEDDIAYIKGSFQQSDGKKTIDTFFLDGKLIGYTKFLGGYCDIIALDPDYQGRGFGRAMLAYAVRKAFDDPKVRFVYLHTFFINVRAQRLYERLGFKRVGGYCLHKSKPKKDMRFSISNSRGEQA